MLHPCRPDLARWRALRARCLKCWRCQRAGAGGGGAPPPPPPPLQGARGAQVRRAPGRVQLGGRAELQRRLGHARLPAAPRAPGRGGARARARPPGRSRARPARQPASAGACAPGRPERRASRPSQRCAWPCGNGRACRRRRADGRGPRGRACEWYLRARRARGPGRASAGRRAGSPAGAAGSHLRCTGRAAGHIAPISSCRRGGVQEVHERANFAMRNVVQAFPRVL